MSQNQDERTGRVAANSGPVLVSDFDGTMTRHDFYKLAIENLLPPDAPDHWAEYRSGTITHFEALRRYFAAIRKTEEEVMAIVQQMELDADLGPAVQALQQAGWTVVVASAGCQWYIRTLLSEAGVDVVVYANPGHYESGRGLMMEMPGDSRYRSELLGVDKTEIVRQHIASGRKVAFAGDGFPDAEAARLVPAHLRFARGDLASVLQSEGLDFQGFPTWSEIARTLLLEKA